MLTATIVLLVLTLASAVLGFRDVLPPVSRIFELLFWVFGVLFVVVLNILLMRRTWKEQVTGPGQNQDPDQ